MALVKLGRSDLHLVDNWMPGLSRPDRTRQVQEFNTSTPILSCSGPEQESDKQEAHDPGVQGYLTKSLEISNLVDEGVAETKIAFPVAIHLP
jgi:CheY-like chemotaxis protein